MRLLQRPAVVVAGWAILNTLLAFVLVGFGATALEFPVYFIGAALVLLNAGAVALAVRRRRGRPVWRQPPPGESVFFLALGIIAAALGWAYSWYLLPVAAVPFILALLRELKARRQRGPAA